jgi:tryptophan synthase alpha chain
VSVDPGHTGQLLRQIRAQGRGALAGFLHVGYPTVDISLQALSALTGAGEWTA